MAAAIGAIIGSAAGGDAASGMASVAQYQAAKHERNRSWDRQRWWALNEPMLRMEGLRRAGLNPALAATGGFPSRSVNVDTASPGGMPSFSRDTGSRVVAARQMEQQIRKQDLLMDAQISSAKSAALRDFFQAKAEEEFQHHRVGAEAWRAAELRERSYLLGEQQRNTRASTARLESDRGLIDLRSQLLNLEMPAARALAEFYAENPWVRQLGAAGREIAPIVRESLRGGDYESIEETHGRGGPRRRRTVTRRR